MGSGLATSRTANSTLHNCAVSTQYGVLCNGKGLGAQKVDDTLAVLSGPPRQPKTPTAFGGPSVLQPQQTSSRYTGLCASRSHLIIAHSIKPPRAPSTGCPPAIL